MGMDKGGCRGPAQGCQDWDKPERAADAPSWLKNVPGAPTTDELW